MAIEMMITEAILRDSFSPVLRRIAGEQDAYARKTSALTMAGNVFAGAGAAVLAFGVKSVKVAGELDEIKKAMAAVGGENKAAFDMNFVDQFAQHSKFTYLDLAEADRKSNV